MARAEPNRDWIEKLRELASRRVEETGLRAVARDVGMSASGLIKFLAGAAPYAPTRRRLLSWSRRQPGAPVVELPAADAEGILHDLVVPLPPAERARVVRALAEIISHAYEQHQHPVPPWLEELLARPGTG